MFFSRTIAGVYHQLHPSHLNSDHSHPAFHHMLNVHESDMWCHDDGYSGMCYIHALVYNMSTVQHSVIETYLTLATHPGLLNTYYILL